jgi:hypothetical protein
MDIESHEASRQAESWRWHRAIPGKELLRFVADGAPCVIAS